MSMHCKTKSTKPTLLSKSHALATSHEKTAQSLSSFSLLFVRYGNSKKSSQYSWKWPTDPVSSIKINENINATVG